MLKDADYNTFTVFDADNDFSKDKAHVYYKGKVIMGADAHTFQPLFYHYAYLWKDKNHLYLFGKLLPGSDSDSFQIIDSQYWKDKNAVYSRLKDKDYIIAGADPQTFRLLGRGYGVDKNNVYHVGEKVEGADRATFYVSTYGAEDRFAIYQGKNRKLKSSDRE